MVSQDLNQCEHLRIVKIYNYLKYLKNHLSFKLILVLQLFLSKKDPFNLFNLKCLLFQYYLESSFHLIIFHCLIGKILSFFIRYFYLNLGFFKMILNYYSLKYYLYLSYFNLMNEIEILFFNFFHPHFPLIITVNLISIVHQILVLFLFLLIILFCKFVFFNQTIIQNL